MMNNGGKRMPKLIKSSENKRSKLSIKKLTCQKAAKKQKCVARRLSIEIETESKLKIGIKKIVKFVIKSLLNLKKK